MARMQWHLPAIAGLLACAPPLASQERAVTADCTAALQTFMTARHPPAPPNLEPDGLAVGGIVTNESGAPLRGFFVMVEGTSLVTRTDSTGAYLLRHMERHPTSRPMLRVCDVGWDYLT